MMPSFTFLDRINMLAWLLSLIYAEFPIIGWIADQNPAATLFVHPTATGAEYFMLLASKLPKEQEQSSRSH
jgi:hypothetical protein